MHMTCHNLKIVLDPFGKQIIEFCWFRFCPLHMTQSIIHVYIYIYMHIEWDTFLLLVLVSYQFDMYVAR